MASVDDSSSGANRLFATQCEKERKSHTVVLPFEQHLASVEGDLNAFMENQRSEVPSSLQNFFVVLPGQDAKLPLLVRFLGGDG